MIGLVTSMEKYTNEHGKECFRGVEPHTHINVDDFHSVPNQLEGDSQWALHTNLGSLTVLHRLTGFGFWDTETGYRDTDRKFWLASGDCDVRYSGVKTMQEMIDWVKERANTCVGV